MHAFQGKDGGGHHPVRSGEVLDRVAHRIDDPVRLNGNNGVTDGRLTAGMPVDRRR